MNDLQIQKLADAIAASIQRTKFSQGDLENPYKEFTFSIADGAAQDIFYACDFMRFLSLSASTGVTFRWGGQGSVSTIAGAGIGYKSNKAVDRITIYNNSGGTLTGTLALCLGDIRDDRLNVSGNVSVINGTTTFNVAMRGTTLADTADVSVTTGATTKVVTGAASMREAMISNLAANGTVVRAGTSSAGAARGIEIPIGGSAVFNTTQDIYVYNPSGGTINIGVLLSKD